MSSKTHTPGPWTAEFTEVKTGKGFQICTIDTLQRNLNWSDMDEVDHADDAPGKSYQIVSDEEAEANARLISAAPDMLEALKTIFTNAEDRDELLDYEVDENEKPKMHQEFLVVLKAILKAEGGSWKQYRSDKKS